VLYFIRKKKCFVYILIKKRNINLTKFIHEL